MWSESLGKEIARFLNLMADQPNARSEGVVTSFDGGQMTEAIGLTSYRFSDGSSATYGSSDEIYLTIKLATGEEINISVEQERPVYVEPATDKINQPAPSDTITGPLELGADTDAKCHRCDHPLTVGDRYCRHCGQDSSIS